MRGLKGHHNWSWSEKPKVTSWFTVKCHESRAQCHESTVKGDVDRGQNITNYGSKVVLIHCKETAEQVMINKVRFRKNYCYKDLLQK